MLFPLRIVWRDPVGLNSADSAGSCRCDDECEYALKDDRDHPLTPHSEWFCTRLAEAVNIACPPCAVVEDNSGNYLFGSRWEGGVARDKWWEMAYRGEIEFQTIAPVLSRILAFDCFVYNDDRHLNNYLFRQSRNGWIVLAFDWSRAWMCHGFPPQYPPFHAKQKTLIAHRYLRNRFGNFVDNTSIDSVLDKIAAIDDNTVENIVRGHPEVWLTDSDKDIMLSWWRSNERLDRILAIKKGISDGSYL